MAEQRDGDGASNPYEVLDLDPGLELEALTELLRERAEAMSPDDRRRVQALWHALAIQDGARARHVLLARPRSVPPPSLRAALSRVEAPALEAVDVDAVALALLQRLRPEDLLVPPWLESDPEDGALFEDELGDDPLLTAGAAAAGGRAGRQSRSEET